MQEIMDTHNVMEDPNKCDEQAILSRLKSQLIEVLTQMDKIRPVQFHDADCDDCLYNFSDVVIDEADDRVYIEIAMWHDNLPAHAKNPLKDGRGRAILPQNKYSHKYVVGLATGGIQEDPEVCYSKFEVIDADCEQDARTLYNDKHNCNFFYGSVIGEVIDGKVQYSEGLRGKFDMSEVDRAVADALNS